MDKDKTFANGYKYLFTVFTPAFNRADTIGRVYRSLSVQTFRDFEWLVVDAGSDRTGELVEGWQKDGASFPIRYVRMENRGKHGAISLGLRFAEGRLFVVLDDDDECVPQALERFRHHWESIPGEDRGRFAGVGVLVADDSGAVFGDKYPYDTMDSTFTELAYVYRISGEKWWAFATEVLREFPFPDEPELHIIPEGMIFHRLTRKYRMRFVNEVLRFYRSNDRQLTRSAPSSHARANCITLSALLDEDIAWFRHHPHLFLKYAALYSRFSFHCGVGLRAQLRALKHPLSKALLVAMWPVGLMAYAIDRKKYA